MLGDQWPGIHRNGLIAVLFIVVVFVFPAF